MRRMFYAIAFALAVFAAAYFLGPRAVADPTVRFDAAAIGPDPEAYLAAREAAYPDIREGLAKEIVWADPERRERTPISIVYLHGFSASKGEVRPLPDLIAAELGANLFYTRLTGHGLDGPAMAEATAEDWIDDTAEALAIGRAIGERVVVIATSTGGTLASWAATRPELSEDVAAMVLIAPNFRVAGAGADLLAAPWGIQIARLVIGPERGFTPTTDLQAHLWTTNYPTAALTPLAATVAMTAASRMEDIGIPALFVFSDEDKVVDARATHAVIARWGGPTRMRLVTDAGDPNRHVIAGDAFSPSTTQQLAGEAVEWLRTVLGGTD